jgi:hypothetical protein
MLECKFDEDLAINSDGQLVEFVREIAGFLMGQTSAQRYAGR